MEIFDFISQNKDISLFDQIAYAMRFLRRSDAEKFINSLCETAQQKGELEKIFLFLPDAKANPEEPKYQKAIEECRRIMERFLAETHDLQHLGLFSVKMHKLGFKEIDPEIYWFKEFRKILNSQKQYEERIQLEREILKELQGHNIPNLNFSGTSGLSGSSSMNIRNNQNLSGKDLQSTAILDFQTSLISPACHGSMRISCSFPFAVSFIGVHQEKKQTQTLDSTTFRIKACQECQTDLPKCSLCLLPISIINPAYDFQDKKNKSNQDQLMNVKDISLDDAIVWCQNCNHGGHFPHLNEWFEEFPECPYQGCNCKCDFKNQFQVI